MKIIKDGNMYCVQANKFINLQESDCYFFIDEEEYKEFIGNIVAVGLSHFGDDFIKFIAENS